MNAKNRWVVVMGLVFFGFMSTSFGKSTAKPSANCAKSWSELAKHPEAGGACSSAKLKSKLSALAGQTWYGMGSQIEFVIPPSNFYIIVDGKKKSGPLCCSAGAWSIPGYGAVNMSGGKLKVGLFSFSNSPPAGATTVADGGRD